MKIPRCSLALAALAVTALFAQAQTDYSKIQIKANKLADNLYTLDGAGGTIGVLTGPEGVFMVDSQFAPLSEKIAATIKQISGGQPIRFLVNTHVHGDHTGGDENFVKMGATIIARPELRDRLAHPAPGPNGQPGRLKLGDDASLVETVRRLAEVRGVSPDRIAEVTTGNFERLMVN